MEYLYRSEVFFGFSCTVFYRGYYGANYMFYMLMFPHVKNMSNTYGGIVQGGREINS